MYPHTALETWYKIVQPFQYKYFVPAPKGSAPRDSSPVRLYRRGKSVGREQTSAVLQKAAHGLPQAFPGWGRLGGRTRCDFTAFLSLSCFDTYRGFALPPVAGMRYGGVRGHGFLRTWLAFFRLSVLLTLCHPPRLLPFCRCFPPCWCSWRSSVSSHSQVLIRECGSLPAERALDCLAHRRCI